MHALHQHGKLSTRQVTPYIHANSFKYYAKLCQQADAQSMSAVSQHQSSLNRPGIDPEDALDVNFVNMPCK